MPFDRWSQSRWDRGSLTQIEFTGCRNISRPRIERPFLCVPKSMSSLTSCAHRHQQESIVSTRSIKESWRTSPDCFWPLALSRARILSWHFTNTCTLNFRAVFYFLIHSITISYAANTFVDHWSLNYQCRYRFRAGGGLGKLSSLIQGGPSSSSLVTERLARLW